MYPKKPMTQARAAKTPSRAPVARKASTPEASPTPHSGRRIQVRRSGVHGKGVFAVTTIRKGELIQEYKGEVISWAEAMRRHPQNPDDPNHTFYFGIEGDKAIDGNHGGNSSRFINHACNANCEADEIDGRIFIKAKRTLKPGEELFYDYGLTIDARYTAKLKKEYECRCGAKNCRGTMLGPKT